MSQSKFNLYRNVTRTGDVIHTAECRYADKGKPWPAVDTMTGLELAQHVEKYSKHLRWCGHCEPDLRITVGTP